MYKSIWVGVVLVVIAVVAYMHYAVDWHDAGVTDDTALRAVGEQCQVDAHCELPFEYALRSDCPFNARCLEGVCSVVCEQVHELIRLETPLPEAVVMSPLTITGQARGYWYFEASFPVVLTDWDGRIIAEGYAEAQDDWMTEEFVPFKATLTFEQPSYGERGMLILRKDNPSGLPEHDDALEVPVRFMIGA